MQFLSSAENINIKEVKSFKLKKNRDEKDLFIIEGTRSVGDALDSGVEFYKVFVSERFLEANSRASRLIEKFNCPVFLVRDSLFRKVSETENPQGILAIVFKSKITLDEEIEKTDFVLVLENVQDPGNVGTIIRTADAAGVGLVIVVGACADVYSPKVVRSTMASLFNVPIIKIESVETCVDLLRDKGFKIYASSLESSLSCFESDLLGKCAILLGNEGNGLSHEAIGLADKSIHIPMKGEAESLNVSIAAGILMFEKLRQEL